MGRAMKRLGDTAYSGPVSMTGVNVLAKAFLRVPFFDWAKKDQSCLIIGRI